MPFYEKEGSGLIELHDKDTGAMIGAITEEQLQFLIDQLEEENPEDKNYWLNRDTLEMLKENGADPRSSPSSKKPWATART